MKFSKIMEEINGATTQADVLSLPVRVGPIVRRKMNRVVKISGKKKK